MNDKVPNYMYNYGKEDFELVDLNNLSVEEIHNYLPQDMAVHNYFEVLMLNGRSQQMALELTLRLLVQEGVRK